MWGTDGTEARVEAGQPRRSLSETYEYEWVRFKIYLDIMVIGLAGDWI